MSAWLLPLHVFSCFAMTGVIWLVQLLVYPNFRHVPVESFGAFHRTHTFRITLLVGPLMLLELVTALLLFLGSSEPRFLINFASVIALWILTACVSVPEHRRLELDPGAGKEAVTVSNWPRTLLWTARSAVWVWALAYFAGL